MLWFFLALAGLFMHAAVVHIDRILLTKYFKSGGVGTLMLFSSLLSILALPVLYFADTSVLNVGAVNIFFLTLVSVLFIIQLLLYFLAIKDDEASVIVIFYQLVPVFGYILGYFILGEALTKTELMAMFIIILGTTFVSFETNAQKKIQIKYKTIIYMVGASFLWALSAVIFKAIAIEENVIRSLFWGNVTLAVFGVLIFAGSKSYRDHFLQALRENSKGIIGLNIFNEALNLIGTAFFSFAYLLAPIALVLLTNTFESFFVLVMGIFLTLLFPKLTQEKITFSHVGLKLTAIIITGFGTYMLLNT